MNAFSSAAEFIDSDDYYFDDRTADLACKWIESHCVFTDDKWAGRPFLLEKWQAEDIVRPLFGWKRKADGLRRYRRVIIWVPRKNGKTELMAAVSLLTLVATGTVGGQVYTIAADEKQARIAFDKATAMVQSSDPLSKAVEPLKTSLFCPQLKSKMVPLSGTVIGKHGLSPTGIFGDEIHEWQSDRILVYLHQGTGAREEPIEFLISTAGTRTGYGWELWQECLKIRDGILNDPETLVVIYAADPEDDWTDPATWAKANPNLGVSLREDYLARECEKAQQSPSLENDFKRYHLNLWTEQDTRWLPMDHWRQCSEDPNNKMLWQSLPARMIGRKAFAAFDLGQTSDITALVFVFPPDPEQGEDRVTVIPRFWVPEDTVARRTQNDRVPYDLWVKSGALEVTPGNVTDYAFLKEAAYTMFRDYECDQAAFDPFNATQVTLEMEQDGLPMVMFRQGFLSMSPPSKELERLVMSRQIEHGNHPVLTWMAANTAVVKDPAGNLKPNKAKSTEKIDGIVALIMGLGLMGGPAVSHESVYETRGVRYA